MKFKERIVRGSVVVSFVAGSLLTACLMHAQQARADRDHVFELLVYHTLPGKEPALESVFRDFAPLQARYVKVVGYWVPNDDPAWANTFIYVVAHPVWKKRKKNWGALHADPAFSPYRKEAAQFIEKVDGRYRVDEVYMRPTDYSSMK